MTSNPARLVTPRQLLRLILAVQPGKSSGRNKKPPGKSPGGGSKAVNRLFELPAVGAQFQDEENAAGDQSGDGHEQQTDINVGGIIGAWT